MALDTRVDFNPYSLVDSTLIFHPAFQRALDRIDQCFKAMENATDPVCIAIVGESRTGKSRALEHFELEHRSERLADGLIVPFARVRVPSKPTVKGLAELMLHRLGDPLYEKGTENTKTIRLKKLLKVVRTRVLALDEFQHFYDKTTQRVQHHVADWLKVIVDEAQVGLVVTGLPNCLSVIRQNEQLTGRFLAPIRLQRMDWMNEDDRKNFRAILRGMQESLAFFDMPSFDSDEMAFRFYCATGGLIGYLVKILKQAVCNAADVDARSISLDDLAVAFKESVIAWESSNNPNPFNSDFSAEPSAESLAMSAAIGIPQLEESAPRQTKKASPPKVREVLSAH